MDYFFIVKQPMMKYTSTVILFNRFIQLHILIIGGKLQINSFDFGYRLCAILNQR